MKVSRDWLNHAFFSLVEHAGIRVLDAIFTITLIRVMGPVEFGIFSVYQSWVAVALLFLPHLELAMFREYGSWKNSGTLPKKLKILETYNLFRIALTIMISLLLATYEQPISFGYRISILLLAFALPLSHSIYSYLRDPLRFEMKQHLVAVVGSLQRVAIIAAAFTSNVFFPSNVAAIAVSVLGTYFAFTFVWKIASKNVVELEPVPFKEVVKNSAAMLAGTAIWIHFNGIVYNITQTLDVLALNAQHVNLEEIGRYAIALKTANFFQMFPVAIVSSFGVYLGKRQHDPNHEKERQAVWQMTIAMVVLCVVFYLCGMFLSEPLLNFIGKNKISSADLVMTKNYFEWQLIGIMILCCSHPLTTFLGARTSLKKVTAESLVPWIAVSYLIYTFAAKQGVLAVAQANIIVYLVYFALMFRLFKKAA